MSPQKSNIKPKRKEPRIHKYCYITSLISFQFIYSRISLDYKSLDFGIYSEVCNVHS